jgi:hypothetical protein
VGGGRPTILGFLRLRLSTAAGGLPRPECGEGGDTGGAQGQRGRGSGGEGERTGWVFEELVGAALVRPAPQNCWSLVIPGSVMTQCLHRFGSSTSMASWWPYRRACEVALRARRGAVSSLSTLG